MPNPGELLYGEDQLNVRYDAASTLSATDTFEARAGNCLSMTSLFIAAARYLGLDAHFQTVAVDPAWDHQGNTMIRYEHIVATGSAGGGRSYVIDFLPEFVVGDMDAKIISDLEAHALFYNNLGAEAIVDGRVDESLVNFRRAIRLRPKFSSAWNNMGAAMRRTGQYELAEFSYLRALDQDYANYSALGNLVLLYRYTDRDGEAAQLKERVKHYHARNPYFNYFQVRAAIRKGHLKEARKHLKKAIRLKRNEPDFYIAMAEIHAAKGEEEEKLKMLDLAKKYTEGVLVAPSRQMSHRFWTTNGVNVVRNPNRQGRL